MWNVTYMRLGTTRKQTSSVLTISVALKHEDLRAARAARGCHGDTKIIVTFNLLLPQCWTRIANHLIWEPAALKERMTATIRLRSFLRKIIAFRFERVWVSTRKLKALPGQFQTLTRWTLAHPRRPKRLFTGFAGWNEILGNRGQPAAILLLASSKQQYQQ